MVPGVRRRLVLSYVVVIGLTLLLLGPILYLSFSRQLTAGADATLRLAAQRQAALSTEQGGLTLGIAHRYRPPAPLSQQDMFYLLLDPAGRVLHDSDHARAHGLPDEAAVSAAERRGSGVFSTITTVDGDEVRLFTVPIVNARRVVAILQAGDARTPLIEAQRGLLLALLALGAAGVAVATLGGVVLSRQVMRPIQGAFAAQRTFVADASHELRTPVALIRSDAEVLLHVGAFSNDDDRALAAHIVSTSDHMGRLIADLLTLARLDANELPIKDSPVDLAGVAAASCARLAPLAERADVLLTLDETAPLAVRGDAARLEQALVILLDNAIAYNRPGGSVAVEVRAEGGHARLRVHDTGQGIAATDMPSIFARFHRGADRDTGATETTTHSGLGLAIAAGIVRRHHGRIRAHSVQGEGATFDILLPLAARGDGPNAGGGRGDG